MTKRRHVCELVNPEKTVPKLPPGSSSWARLKRWLLVNRLASLTNPRGIKCLGSVSALRSEQLLQLRDKHWCIIHPFSNLHTFWQGIMAIVFLLFLIIIPFYLTFMNTRKPYITMMVICLTLDFICILDIILNFFTGFFNCPKKRVVLRPRRVFFHYLQTYFFIDLISSLPLQLILNEEVYSHKLMAYLKCLKLIKLFRIKTLNSYIKNIMSVYRVDYQWAHQMIVYSLLFIHWAACFHFFVPLFMASFDTSRIHQESWLSQINVMDNPITKRYVHSLFRAICNSLALSYGQMNVSTNVDNAVCGIIVVLGTGLTMYATMMYISHRCSNNVRVVRYHKILDEMKEYMRYKQLPEAMQLRMLRYFDYYFHHNYYVDKFYMNLLPPHLKQEIHHISTVNLVRNTQMFKELPKDVLERLVDTLVLEVFATGETILKAGSASECMYFIASGTAVETLHTGQEICHLEDGDTIGELELILVEHRRVVNVIAIEMCQLYRLDTKYYKEIVVQCTLSFKDVYMSALERREEYSKMEKEANKARMKNVQLM